MPMRHPYGNVSEKATHEGWKSKERPRQYSFRSKGMLFKTSKPDKIIKEVSVKRKEKVSNDPAHMTG